MLCKLVYKLVNTVALHIEYNLGKSQRASTRIIYEAVKQDPAASPVTKKKLEGNKFLGGTSAHLPTSPNIVQ